MGKKVLIVDDAVFMRRMLTTILEENGFDVVGEGVDGDDALKKYIELEPDVVTMDITMPNCDGIGGVKKIKAAYPDAKIVMVSAMGQQKLVMESIGAGALGFIVKPFKPGKVVETLESVLKK